MLDIFLYFFNMSITAGYLVLAIVFARFIFKKLPKWSFCVMWGLVGFRLVCPFSLKSVLSLIPTNIALSSDEIYSHSTINPTGSNVLNYIGGKAIDYNFSVENGSITLENFVANQPVYANPLYLITYIASIIWVVGLCLLLIYSLVSYMRLYIKVKPSILYENNVYYCDNITTPFILGVIKPKIYIPSGLDDETVEYVISHEKAHLKRMDHIWKPLGFSLLSIYWFNPLMWVAYILLCRDIEKACDEKVIKNQESSYKKGYSQALLTCATDRKMILACPLAFGEVGVKERIKSVLNYKKPAFWVIIIALMLSIFMSIGFLTMPEATAKDVIEESGYHIYSNNPKNITLKIPSELVTGKMKETGISNFFKNKYVVYETENTKIYLDKIATYEDHNRVYLGFDFSYSKLSNSGSVLVGYYKDNVGYPSALKLNDSAIIIGEEKVLNAVDLTSNGPAGYFELAFNMAKLEDAKGAILVDLSCHEISYAKNGMEGDYYLDRNDFTKDMILTPTEVIMHSTTRGSVYDSENLPEFELSQGMYFTEILQGSKYFPLGEMKSDWQGKYDLYTRLVSDIWADGYSAEEFYHNIRNSWELEYQGILYTLFEMYDAQMYLGVGSYNSGAGMQNDDDSYYKEIYKIYSSPVQTVYSFEQSGDSVKPQFILNSEDNTYAFLVNYKENYVLTGIYKIEQDRLMFFDEENTKEALFVFEKTDYGYQIVHEESQYLKHYPEDFNDPAFNSAEFVAHTQRCIIDETIEHRFIFPTAQMLGNYTSTEFKTISKGGLFPSDMYILSVNYSEKEYTKAKKLTDSMYVYENVPIGNNSYSTQFESEDFVFRLIDGDEYGLRGIPKEMLFVGYSDLRQELIFICYYDTELDRIPFDDLNDFLHYECPEIFEYAPYIKSSEINKIEISAQPRDKRYEKVFTSSATISKLSQLLNDAEKSADLMEDPSEFNGMSIVLNFCNKAGGENQISLFAGQFIKYDNGPWMVFNDNSYEKITEFLSETQTQAEIQEESTLVYSSVTDEYGEYIETPDYSISLSEGWVLDSSTGDYLNHKKGQSASVQQIKFAFDDYYQLRKESYNKKRRDLGADCVFWEEHLGEMDMLGVKNRCIYTEINGSGVDVITFYEYENRVYKVSVHSDNRMTDVSELKGFYDRIMMK